MTKKINHTHKLRRHTYTTGNQVYFCTLDDCGYKIDCGLALGKSSLCNRCGQPFILTELSIRLAKPHCEACSKRKVKDTDGATRYINPREVATEIAADRVQSLEDRLRGAVAIGVDSIEDI